MSCGFYKQSEANTPDELKEIKDSGHEFRIIERPNSRGDMRFYPQTRMSLFFGIKVWVGMVCDEFSFYDAEYPSHRKYTSTKSKALGTILESVRASNPKKVHSV